MKLSEPKDIPKSSLLNPNPLTQWSGPRNIAQVKSDGESSWAFLDSGSTINAVIPEFIEARSLDVCPLSNLSDSTLDIRYKWLWKSVLLAFGLYYHKGSGRRSLRLQQRSSGHSHTRLYWLWILSTDYSGYTNHQSDHQCDQGKWNQWVISFFEWIKDGQVAGMQASRPLDKVRSCYTPNCVSDWLRGGSQNDKEGRDRCFFIQNCTQPNENHAPGR